MRTARRTVNDGHAGKNGKRRDAHNGPCRYLPVNEIVVPWILLFHPHVEEGDVRCPAALSAPLITVREAETSALVRNGQTVVIGGLIDESTEEVEDGIPFLKDIPLLAILAP
jgi:hypothetical protein